MLARYKGPAKFTPFPTKRLTFPHILHLTLSPYNASTMATFRINTTITASKRSSKCLSIASIASLASSNNSVYSATEDNPIVVTTTVGPSPYMYITPTVSTTSAPYPYPAPIPPPFTTSRGSDELVPRPRHGAPPVAPAQTADERAKKQRRRRSLLGFVVGRKPEAPALNPALCEGWWCTMPNA
ncbi:hypothetical protein C8R46DRAFT_1206256 [Mycena filopes]|nr:hypothetical protein C8R46DRAFT_1206256 [Mycena filopes]